MSADRPAGVGPVSGGQGGEQDRGNRRGGPGRGRGRRGGGRREQPVVPDANFVSYYGRPVVRASPWKADIPTYFFAGGLAAGSSLLAAGADLTGRPGLRRATRIAALGSVGVSLYTLVHDLGRPARALNMLRVIKPTSPMSMGTWSLTAFGPLAGVAAVAEVAPALERRLPPRLRWTARLLAVAARPSGLLAAAVAPMVGTYTGVLIADTATPAWHEGRRELPYVFAASAATAAAGLGMITAPVAEAGPARRMGMIGAAADLVAEYRMETSMGIVSQTLREGSAGRLMRASKVLTLGGALGVLVLGRRSRVAAIASGAALLAGSAGTKFGIFHAGQASALDPRYTVVPQRERMEGGGSTGPRRP
ncbi:NrfD/PsrC family molybdoenzyme membrane anchor subunit [Microlunatus endophyticus]|uniref:NrfD/PsrC family molybdoenzyme membrane anchor subunit n=1 Tax=Microlunatus endophyticus TaxID=1716077 RepID=UPI00166481AF|nr:NrfD/PsrC family molybdoenzyme membrane anchor subunit [Microlunatus endophyticus]